MSELERRNLHEVLFGRYSKQQVLMIGQKSQENSFTATQKQKSNSIICLEKTIKQGNENKSSDKIYNISIKSEKGNSDSMDKTFAGNNKHIINRITLPT
mgnify:CR=1 FL=1